MCFEFLYRVDTIRSEARVFKSIVHIYLGCYEFSIKRKRWKLKVCSLSSRQFKPQVSEIILNSEIINARENPFTTFLSKLIKLYRKSHLFRMLGRVSELNQSSFIGSDLILIGFKLLVSLRCFYYSSTCSNN